MKVFVTGANGYIGFNVASAFRRAGHEVWGLVRSEKKAHAIAMHEIHPVIGSMQHPESYQQIAEQCAMLIHAAVDYQADTFSLDRRTMEVLLATGTRGLQPKTVVYTSGTWVYGDTLGKTVDEGASLKPAPLIAGRPDIEQMVLKASEVRGVVVRPGCVYGRQGGLTGMWFDGPDKGRQLQVIGDGSNHWAMVHVDDLAEGYLRAAERGLGGEVFNLTDQSRSTVREMADAVARATGYTGQAQFVPADEASYILDGFAECLTLDQRVDSSKAVRLLGWQSKHPGFIDGVDTYFQSWKAAQYA
ncbi:NAD-dependent epimerase/dehydratase [Candidatus Methylomirabilis lanthanidiphila]|uniref:NAD-dependent epimerase/dehydratase n=1 Tax=Candidatus Methylomirabilis lanthanidiphila TaxID=2211376 RepID=A0A564ZJW2_9BACT|nr:NAD-dependent epimerase/dehydratase family protein [Candidatus Methylomirabilis lanthanidiphila]VUZ85631.1 NAD-dependent epimerase/dehydratase [Candidatus Methylomirabilis lanthanidiphila]